MAAAPVGVENDLVYDAGKDVEEQEDCGGSDVLSDGGVQAWSGVLGDVGWLEEGGVSECFVVLCGRESGDVRHSLLWKPLFTTPPDVGSNSAKTYVLSKVQKQCTSRDR